MQGACSWGPESDTPSSLTRVIKVPFNSVGLFPIPLARAAQQQQQQQQQQREEKRRTLMGKENERKKGTNQLANDKHYNAHHCIGRKTKNNNIVSLSLSSMCVGEL
jgi:hypothetical protein